MTEKILLVEDSHVFSDVLRTKIVQELGYEVDCAPDFATAQALLAKDTAYFIALLDLGLPDAPTGASVDLVREHNIPAVVFTGEISDDVQEFIWTKRVVDYVLKEGPHSVEYILTLVARIARNRSTKILVVDDSYVARQHLKNLLEVHQYQVMEASNGVEGMQCVEEHPDVKLVLTDFHMPEMDGFELVKRLRQRYGMEQVAIIGLSTQGNHKLAVRFIKHGANDFISKPFLSEQFYCRVVQNITLVEHFEALRAQSRLDYLTGLFNRRYLFDAGQPLLARAHRKEDTICIGMIDIDFFKKINDAHGHGVGDEVLRNISKILGHSFRRSDIVCRYGGEEFCVLGTDMDPEKAARIFEGVRQHIEETPTLVEGHEVHATVSIGICTELKGSLEEMLREADQKLYLAKRQGRNRVVV